ncbi:IgA Peptidase M64 [Lentzea albidocapillata subsp. violacea]|uniref:IgA Peptidase M64 n=1 Tax=Lentzea albidocapillata subsp. violacea TaxID=128104 RepID=A0A1G9UJX1_9PSEU|nr:M64 family metallopeptidase [Lentzea albidocapillata]SDM60186.1 IgA Peptidase M64 [Lentzea albidocapillata subsp. violacea]
MHRSRLLLPALTMSALALFAQVPAGGAAPAMEWREVFNEDGSITQALTPKPPAEKSTDLRALAAADVIPVQVTGDSADRFDLVFVGDGYTTDDLATYAANVKSKWEELSAVEPFATYKQYFNVWQVNVISAESGVDHDPTKGLLKNTALDMGFWCQGRDANTERLLCVNETKAKEFAALAPQSDQVIALGNTTKYGGAGGSVATAAGSNAQAGQIAIHELGHSIGGLADEYDYPYANYTGTEPREINVTKDPTGAKWSEYLGQPSPDGGVIAPVEGARYYKTGLYRPTANSIMRTLGKEFNSIGRDAMIKAFKAKIPSLNEPGTPPPAR